MSIADWIAAIATPVIVIALLTGIAYSDRIAEWVRKRNGVKSTATLTITATNPNTAGYSTEYRIVKPLPAIAQSVEHSPGRMDRMEIRAAEPVIVEYSATMTREEMSAIKRILEDWVNAHSGMPAYEMELSAACDFLRAYAKKDRV